MLIGTLFLIGLALWFVHWLTTPERRSLTLTAARLFRRAGRWLWAVGEGLEHGFLHSQRVRHQIPLDLEAQP
jgi:hypothetical protein